MELKDLKEQYAKLQKKHSLPSFRELNDFFEIDRIDRECDNLLREIRKTMMDKVISYIRFLEMMLNPSSAPPMFMMFLKEVSSDDKDVMEKVYKGFIDLELSALKLEIDYNEEGEAEIINKILETWLGLREDMGTVLGVMERNWNSTSKKKEKSYFG